MTGNKSQRRSRLSMQIGLAKLASAIIIGAGWLVLLGTPSSVAQANYYVNSLWGSNSFDGLQPVPVGGGSGPKQQVSAAIAAAASGDTIEIAKGLYQDTVWSPGSKNLVLRPMGLVKLVDYDPRSADSDNDGMNDAWEAYYGFDPYTAQSGDYAPGADPDQDGFTNAQESELRTNPNIPNVHTPSVAPLPEQGNAGYGLFEGPVSVTLTTDTAGATIRYTLDGTDPTANSTVYLGPLELSGTNDSTFFTVTARAFKAGCDPSDAASVWYMVMPVPMAEFIATDTTVQGNWKGVYGADGYNLAGDAAAYPDYVHSTFSYLPGPCLWASATNDWRALLKASDTNNADRIAAGWCGATGEYFDLNFGDGQTHQVALYFLDWEQLGRSLDVYIQDYYAGPVLNLDYQTVTNFPKGHHLTWNLRGHVLVIVVPSDWGNYEGVLSGIFFQPTNSPPAVVMPFIEPNGGTFVDGVVVGLSNVTAGATVHYTLDGSDPTTNSVLYSEPLLLTNDATVKARGFLTGHTNSWVSRADFEIVPPATAEFVGTDWLTQGGWNGWYGEDGYQVVGGAASYPSYAQLTTNGAGTVTWAASTNDVRALQAEAGTTNRVAAAWYSDFTFDLALNLPYGQTNVVALYFLDWQRLGLEQSIEILDAVSGTWLDSQLVSDFGDGQYLVWELSGPVTIMVTSLSTNLAPVLSGVFFDPLAPPLAPTGLTITSFSTNAVTLAWTSNATNAQGIKIERSEDGGMTYRVLATVGTNLTSYTDSAVTRDTTYGYQLVAYNTLDGNSARAALAPPSITATIIPAPNAAGWNNNSVVVHFTTNNAVSVTGDIQVNGETNGLEVTGMAVSSAGLPAYATAIVSIDTTPPVLTGHPADGEMEQNRRAPVAVNYSDNLSGVDRSSLRVIVDLSTDITAQMAHLLQGAIYFPPADWALGGHFLEVTAADVAGNSITEVAYFTIGDDTNGPALFELNVEPYTLAPDMEQIWIQGKRRDTNMTVSVSVNFGASRAMSLNRDQFGMFVPLEPGTNLVVITVGSTNTTTVPLVVERSDRYRAEVTEPGVDVFGNGQAVTYAGYMSAKRDEGSDNESALVGVQVNGQSVSLSNPDGDGNRWWQTTVPAPATGHGDEFTSINVVASFGNGQTINVPLAVREGYEIPRGQGHYVHELVEWEQNLSCGGDWALLSGTTYSNDWQSTFDAPTGASASLDQTFGLSGGYCASAPTGMGVPFNTVTTNASGGIVGVSVGAMWRETSCVRNCPEGEVCPCPPDCNFMSYEYENFSAEDNSVSFRTPQIWRRDGETTTALMTFSNLWYATGSGLETNPTNVLLKIDGSEVAPVSWTTNTTSYLVPLRSGAEYALGATNFSSTDITVTNTSPKWKNLDCTNIIHIQQLGFTGVHNEKPTETFEIWAVSADRYANDIWCWWFHDNLHVPHYNDNPTLHATGESEKYNGQGTYVWELVGGTGFYDLLLMNANRNGLVQTVTIYNDPYANAQAINFSPYPDNITIRLTYTPPGSPYALTPCEKKTTIKTFVLNQVKITTNWTGVGWHTFRTTEITDQFGNPIPGPIPFNEFFTDFQDDVYPSGENWVWPPRVNWSGGTGVQFTDHIRIAGVNENPKPVGEYSPFKDVAVDRAIQTWRCGSETPGQGNVILNGRARLQRNLGYAQWTIIAPTCP